MRNTDCAPKSPHGPSGIQRSALVGAIGIGAQKCASSWIHAIAGSHPNIGVGDPKELDFFSYYFDRGYQWYESHFSSGGEQFLQFENSPSYFYDHRAPARASAYNAELKIVLLLREPVKRAFSNHLHEVIKGHIGPISFEEGLANNPAYLEQGLYAKHLSAWYQYFPKDRILVLFAEDISKAPADAAQTLFGFLGVDTTFDSAILHERRNESDRAKLPTLRAGLRAGGDWMRRRGLETALARLKSVGPVASLLRANSVDVRAEVPAMRPETQRDLTEHFAREMARLRHMLELERLPWDPPN